MGVKADKTAGAEKPVLSGPALSLIYSFSITLPAFSELSFLRQFQNSLYFINDSLQYVQAGVAAPSLFPASALQVPAWLPDWESPSLKPMKVSSSVTRVPVRLQCVKPSRRRGQWDMCVIRAAVQLSLCAQEGSNSTFASAQKSSMPWAAQSLLLGNQSLGKGLPLEWQRWFNVTNWVILGFWAKTHHQGTWGVTGQTLSLQGEPCRASGQPEIALLVREWCCWAPGL